MVSRFEKFCREHIPRAASNVISSVCDNCSVHKQTHHFHSAVVVPFKGVSNVNNQIMLGLCTYSGTNIVHYQNPDLCIVRSQGVVPSHMNFIIGRITK